MSSSKSEEPLNGDQDQAEISIDVLPHGGKKINEYVLSPNMHSIATLSEEDKSIVVWSITEELAVKYDSSLTISDLKHPFDTYEFESNKLIGISDCKQVILRLDNLVIIDVATKSGQILSAQGLKEWASIDFLENGDLAIIKGYPVYRAYIFSKSKSDGIYQWTCKNSIELEEFHECSVFQNGKLFIVFRKPNVIQQWDLITQKFEMQYILDWNLYYFTLKMKLNSENTLLAVSGNKVYVYSTKSGILMANSR
ncbi:14821_t:CDS:2 [Cetraspora pellucida]|uniref:14821_t:CDS:1 n=1 Tax=Cetraspora pellucida TaxID=1433469 RepID=A0ACA9JVX6_9GLOM|nr:14821_t:CDS:2 [Cetraspora pellucida]